MKTNKLWQNHKSEDNHNDDMTNLVNSQAERIATLEKELEQQKIMNPISVNMIATIEGLSKKLSVAVKALDLWNETGDIDTIRYAAEQALKEISGEQGEKE